jgi:hypothetical protein
LRGGGRGGRGRGTGRGRDGRMEGKKRRENGRERKDERKIKNDMVKLYQVIVEYSILEIYSTYYYLSTEPNEFITFVKNA